MPKSPYTQKTDPLFKEREDILSKNIKHNYQNLRIHQRNSCQWQPLDESLDILSNLNATNYKKSKRVVVAINEKGYRIGMSHHNARIADEIIDKIRDLHEEEGYTYNKLASMFNLNKSVIAKICTYERRAQTPDRWKTIKVYR